MLLNSAVGVGGEVHIKVWHARAHGQREEGAFAASESANTMGGGFGERNSAPALSLYFFRSSIFRVQVTMESE